MPEIQLTIDGREVRAEEGTTILEAARKAGIAIPHLCYREDLTPTTGCRLCVVEVEGARTLVASCAMPAAEKMVVRTNTHRVQNARKTGRRAAPFRPSLRLHDLREERHLPPGKIRLPVRDPQAPIPGRTARLPPAGLQPFLRAGLQQVHPLRTVRHGLP